MLVRVDKVRYKQWAAAETRADGKYRYACSASVQPMMLMEDGRYQDIEGQALNLLTDQLHFPMSITGVLIYDEDEQGGSPSAATLAADQSALYAAETSRLYYDPDPSLRWIGREVELVVTNPS